MKRWLIDTLLVIAEIIGGIIICFVFFLISIIGFFYTLIKHLIKLDYSAKQQFKPIMRAFTLVNDCFANASGGEMLNDIEKVRDGEIRFGNWYETISAIYGLRFMFNNRDSEINLRGFLNKIEKDHCEKAPVEMQLFYYKNK